MALQDEAYSHAGHLVGSKANSDLRLTCSCYAHLLCRLQHRPELEVFPTTYFEDHSLKDLAGLEL